MGEPAQLTHSQLFAGLAPFRSVRSQIAGSQVEQAGTPHGLSRAAAGQDVTVNLAKPVRAAVVGLLIASALGACTSDEEESPNADAESSEATVSPGDEGSDDVATNGDGPPSPDVIRSYVEATTAYDEKLLEEAREIVIPGSPADEALDFYLANIDLAATGSSTLPTLEMREVDDGWQVCWSIETVDDCGEFSNFRGEDGKLVSYDINGTSIDGTTLVGNGTAAEGDWGSVTLRVADIGSGSLYVIVDIQAGDVALSVRNGEVTYRTADGEELDAAMTNMATDIEPGQTETFGISVDRATELAGEVEVSLRTTDGSFEGKVVVPIEE